VAARDVPRGEDASAARSRRAAPGCVGIGQSFRRSGSSPDEQDRSGTRSTACEPCSQDSLRLPLTPCVTHGEIHIVVSRPETDLPRRPARYLRLDGSLLLICSTSPRDSPASSRWRFQSRGSSARRRAASLQDPQQREGDPSPSPWPRLGRTRSPNRSHRAGDDPAATPPACAVLLRSFARVARRLSDLTSGSASPPQPDRR